MPRTQRKPFPALGAALLVLGLAAGCTSTPPPEPEPTTSAPAPAPEPEPTAEPVVLWPLTGMVVEEESGADTPDGHILFGPVLSVKIDNAPNARPQRGIDQADIVWEQLVEGGLTRLLAMFHSDVPAEFGPVRSVRPMDAPIAGPAGGIFVFSGGHQEFSARVAATGVVMKSEDGHSPGLAPGTNSRGARHLYGNSQELIEGSTELPGPPQFFAYPDTTADPTAQPSAVTDGRAVRGVATTFPSSRPAWEWAGDRWLRSESAAPAMAESGMAIGAENVLVLRVETRDTGYRDAGGASVPETILTGSGPAQVFTGGFVIDGTWSKDGDTDLLVLRDAAGAEITLAPGQTWVELLPSNATVTITE